MNVVPVNGGTCMFGRTRIPRNAVSGLPALFHKIRVNL